jgi:HD superfamily phosphohydrolase
MNGEMRIAALLFAKYQMYRSVYCHPDVRAATAIVRKSIFLGLAGGIIQPNDLYGLDDMSFGRLINHAKFPSFKLARDAEEKRIYRLAAEHPFDENNPVHSELLEVAKRVEAESALAQAAGIAENDVVIDIPEQIKLETDLMVKSEDFFMSFDQRSTVFQPATVEQVSKTLRTIRVYIRPQASADSMRIAELVNVLLG